MAEQCLLLLTLWLSVCSTPVFPPGTCTSVLFSSVLGPGCLTDIPVSSTMTSGSEQAPRGTAWLAEVGLTPVPDLAVGCKAISSCFPVRSSENARLVRLIPLNFNPLYSLLQGSDLGNVRKRSFLLVLLQLVLFFALFVICVILWVSSILCDIYVRLSHTGLQYHIQEHMWNSVCPV